MDRDRFDELYHRYWSYVFVVCRTRLDDTEEALDAAMEVFLRKWRAIDTYDPTRASFKTWLSRNAEKLCIDLLRKRRTRGQSVPYTDEAAPIDPDEAASPLLQQVSLCLRSMDPMDRQLVLMHEVEGYTWEEIAAVTNVSVWQVRMRVGRSLRRLEAQLERDA